MVLVRERIVDDRQVAYVGALGWQQVARQPWAGVVVAGVYDAVGAVEIAKQLAG